MSGTVNQALVSHHSRGASKEQALRRRDATGGEMDMLAKVLSDPSPDPKEVRDYIVRLMQQEHIPFQAAGQVLASMPGDPAALRNWARSMFSFVMHQGIHAHAAFPRELYPSAQQAPDGQAAPATENSANQPPQGP